MGWGISELVWTFAILGLVALFGKKTWLKIYNDFRGIKQKMEEIDKKKK